MRRRHFSLIPVMASLALLVAAAPAGAFNEAVNTGDTGLATVQDEIATPGVKCFYENNAGAQNDELDRIRVRDFFTHAPYPQDSTVGYRFIVKRQVPPFTGAFKTVYQSPIIKKVANDAEVAFFPARTWTAPEGTKAQYRVQILLYFYDIGSQSDVVGRIRGLMEVYKHQLSPTKTFTLGDVGSAGECRRNYHGL